MYGFVNRAGELALLGRLAASDNREMLVVYGRRRLGKTALLRQFGVTRPLAFFSCPLSTASEALRLFTRELARTFDEPLLARTRFPGWSEAVEYALERCGREGTPLVLDELPYLQRSAPGIDALLQHAWDGHDGAVKRSSPARPSPSWMPRWRILGRRSTAAARRSSSCNR